MKVLAKHMYGHNMTKLDIAATPDRQSTTAKQHLDGCNHCTTTCAFGIPGNPSSLSRKLAPCMLCCEGTRLPGHTSSLRHCSAHLIQCSPPVAITALALL